MICWSGSARRRSTCRAEGTPAASRAQLAEQGIVARAGAADVGRLAAIVDGEDAAPAEVRNPARLLLDQIAGLSGKISGLDTESGDLQEPAAPRGC